MITTNVRTHSKLILRKCCCYFVSWKIPVTMWTAHLWACTMMNGGNSTIEIIELSLYILWAKGMVYGCVWFTRPLHFASDSTASCQGEKLSHLACPFCNDITKPKPRQSWNVLDVDMLAYVGWLCNYWDQRSNSAIVKFTKFFIEISEVMTSSLPHKRPCFLRIS